jgi:hypothetical protein
MSQFLNKTAVLLGCILFFAASTARSQSWEPIAGADELRALFSDTVMTATLKENVTAIATYNSDGCGELEAWGYTFPRSWQVKNDEQVCIEIDEQARCFRIEKDAGSDQYRAFDVD